MSIKKKEKDDNHVESRTRDRRERFKASDDLRPQFANCVHRAAQLDIRARRIRN